MAPNTENDIRRVAIIGGGPAACTVGQLLAEHGVRVGVFFEENERSIQIGESLVPGVIPVLQELGVEEAVRSFARNKPGALIRLPSGEELEFIFDEIPGSHPGYAYNVPRAEFNQCLREAAREAGVSFLRQRAELARDGERVRLVGEAENRLSSLFEDRPDLIIDATGRARVVANLLDLGTIRGPRTDTALFTHFDTLGNTERGYSYADLHEYGWNWRIPLPDRTSFGLVVDSNHLDEYGETPDEKLAEYIASSSYLSDITRSASRLEPVYEFSNYQLISESLYGPNWVLVGDAAGFVDPIFSTGLYLGMEGARRLAGHLIEEGTKEFPAYESFMLSTFQNWLRIINGFYSGRLTALFKTGKDLLEDPDHEGVPEGMKRKIGTIFTGVAGDTDDYFEQLEFFMEHGLKEEHDPGDYRIHQTAKEST